jgi:hypothetical protein
MSNAVLIVDGAYLMMNAKQQKNPIDLSNQGIANFVTVWRLLFVVLPLVSWDKSTAHVILSHQSIAERDCVARQVCEELIGQPFSNSYWFDAAGDVVSDTQRERLNRLKTNQFKVHMHQTAFAWHP